MRVTEVSYTRVKSDAMYGNHQATVHGELVEGEDPAAALAEARRLVCEAVGEWGRSRSGMSGEGGDRVAEFLAREVEYREEWGELDRAEDLGGDDELIDEPVEFIVVAD